MLTRKGYILLDKINNLIDRAHDHGLTNKWMYESTRNLPKIKVRPDDTKLPFVLNMNNLQSVFWILISGLGLATTAFVLELYCYNKVLR